MGGVHRLLRSIGPVRMLDVAIVRRVRRGGLSMLGGVVYEKKKGIGVLTDLPKPHHIERANVPFTTHERLRSERRSR